MKVIIAGSRNIQNKDYVLSKLNEELEPEKVEEVVSGGADGVDTIGEIWAENNGVPVERFDPEWEKYGKSAGHIRNNEMAKYADKLVAFWDGDSRGTKSMIEKAESEGIPRKVYFRN